VIGDLARQMGDHFARQTEAALRLVIEQRFGKGAVLCTLWFGRVDAGGRASTYYVDGEPLLRVHAPVLTTREGLGGATVYDAVQQIEFLATTPADGPRFYVPVDGGSPLPLPDGRVPDGRILVGTKEQLLIMAAWLRPEDFPC
jgi:hypothetical protein